MENTVTDTPSDTDTRRLNELTEQAETARRALFEDAHEMVKAELRGELFEQIEWRNRFNSHLEEYVNSRIGRVLIYRRLAHLT